MMERRRFLRTITGATLVLAAGCAANSDSGGPSHSPSPAASPTGSCESVEITQASVSVDYECDTGEVRTGRVAGRAEQCEADLSLEVRDGSKTLEEVSLQPETAEWSVGFGEGPGQLRTIPEPGEKRVRVRGPSGDVITSAQLQVSHYLDGPDLDVWRPEFAPKEVAPGEAVTVEFGIATFGAAASVTAALLVDGDAVETRDGTVDRGTDCQTASGPRYEFSHAFEQPGTYELAGRVTVEGSPEAGETRTIGTVTVTQ